MDRNELAALAGSIASTGIAAYGLLQYSAAAPVGAIMLTAFLSYLFNARIQSSTRKYELRRLQSTEVLGPVYGQVTRAIELLENHKKELKTNLGNLTQVEWDKIKHGYCIHLIDKRLQSTINEFFKDFEQLRKSLDEARVKLRKLEEQLWDSIYSGGKGYHHTQEYRLVDDYGNSKPV